MPSNQSTTGTSTTTVQAPQATNSTLNSLYTSLFGQMSPQSASTISGIESGSTLTSNVNQLYSSLQTNSQNAYQQGIASIKASTGAAGTALSTGTNAQIGNYANSYIQNLNNTATSMGLQEEGTQLSAATGVLGSLSQAANSYYSPGSTTSSSGNTSMPWTQGFSAIASLFS